VRRNILLIAATVLLSAAVLTGASVQRWIHIRVESAKGASGDVSFNVPIEMASAVLPAIPTDREHHGKFDIQASIDGADLRALLDSVRNSPDNVFITMERHEAEVSVAKSGRFLLIKIVNKPTPEHRSGKTIAIKVPTSVVRAMVSGNSNEIDVNAGIHALALEGEVDVTVNSDKETVRVWTDTRTTTD
jgi:hypothetical protein